MASRDGVRGSFDRPPISIATSRGKLVMNLVGLAAFLAVAYFFVLPRLAVLAYITFVWIGVMTLLGLIKMISPDRLQLDPGGLRYNTFLGTVIEAPWSDVGPFRTWRVTERTEGVLFDVSEKLRPKVRYQGLNKGMTRSDVSLAGAWPISGSELAALLNEAKCKWGSKSSDV